MAKTLLDELLVGLGFEYDPKDVKKFKEDLDKTVSSIKSLVKIAASGAAAITGLTIASTRASNEQGKLANEIGDTVENIDALTFASNRAGDPTGSLANSLQQLAIRSSEAARGTGSGVEAFGILGISATDARGKLKPVSELFVQISSSLQGLSRSQQIELAGKLGLKGSIRLLQQGPKAIRELTNEAMALGVTTGEDAAVAEEFQDSLVDLWRIIKQVSRVLTRSLAPILNDLIDSLTEWWKTNRELIEQNIPKWIEGFTKALKLLTIAFGFLFALRIATHLITFIGLIKGLTLSTLALNAAMFLLPILIGAIIAAIVLLAEDAHTFFEGGDSFIGDMLKKYPKWADQIRSVASVFATLYDLTMMVFDGWSRIFKLFEESTFEDVKEFFKNLPGFLGDITGIYTVEDRLAADLARQENIRNSQRIDKVEINVAGSSDPNATANEVYNIFQQSSQDLNSAVDQ